MGHTINSRELETTRRALLSLGLAGVGAALAQAVPGQPGLAAQWQSGQSWRIEYLRPTPSPAAQPSPPLGSLERSIWTYRVIEIEPQRTKLEAVEEGGSRNFALWFSAPLPSLRRAVKIIDNRSIDMIVHSAQSPYFGWSSAYPLIFDWPALPRSKAAFRSNFIDDDGLQVSEVCRFTSQTQFEIVMTLSRKVDSGFSETRRSTQAWSVGSPWWSEASIQTESTLDGKKSAETNLRGRLIL